MCKIKQNYVVNLMINWFAKEQHKANMNKCKLI